MEIAKPIFFAFKFCNFIPSKKPHIIARVWGGAQRLPKDIKISDIYIP